MSTKEILITHSDQLVYPRSATFVPAFIIEPSSSALREQRGNLYLLQDCSPAYFPLANMVKRIFEFEYFKHTPKDSALTCLEQTMALANRKIQSFTQAHGNPNEFYSVLCAVLLEKTLHLMQIGASNIFLLRKGALKKISNVANVETPYFSNIATGSMAIGDTLILANASLLESLPLKRMKQIIASNYPSTAVAELRNVLVTQSSAESTMSLILVELNTPESKEQQKNIQADEPSLFKKTTLAEEPIDIEEDEEDKYPPTVPQKKVTPPPYYNDDDESPLGELGKWKSASTPAQELPLPQKSYHEDVALDESDLSSMVREASSVLERNLHDDFLENKYSSTEEASTSSKTTVEFLNNEPQKPYQPKIDFSKLYPQISYSFTDRVKDFVLTSWNKLFSLSKKVQENLPPQEKLLGNITSIKDRLSASPLKDLAPSMSASLSSFKDVRVQKRHLFLILGVLTLVLVGLMLLASWKQQQIRQQITALQSSLDERYNHAVIALESNDIPEAKQTLTSALDLARQIVLKDKTSKEAKQKVLTIQDKLDKIDGIVRVASVDPLADLTTLDKSSHLPTSLLLHESGLYILDPKADSLYQYSFSNRKLARLLQAPAQAKGFLYASLWGDTIFIYSQNSVVSSYALATDSLRSLSVSLGGIWNSADGLMAFDDKVYLVDKKGDQVWRYRPMGEEYTSSRVFEGDTMSLQGLQDIGIDGDVYLLKQSGALIRATQTQQPDTSFSVTGIYPPITKPLTLTMDANKQADIFIADQTTDGQRIVQINKNGLFRRQYVLPESFTPSIKDLAIDYSAEKLYLLAGTSVYAFALTK